MYYVDMTQDRPQNGLPFLTTQYYAIQECPLYPHLKNSRPNVWEPPCKQNFCSEQPCCWPYTCDDDYGLCDLEDSCQEDDAIYGDDY